MGILDRFTKKSQKKQLAALEDNADVRAPKKTASKPAVKSRETAEGKSAVPTSGNHGQSASILLRPVASEKAAIYEAKGTYTFVVSGRANKTEIKRAVHAVYGVLPVAVRVINMEGKRVRFGTTFGKRKDSKKAMVTLPKGKTIQIHEGV